MRGASPSPSIDSLDRMSLDSRNVTASFIKFEDYKLFLVAFFVPHTAVISTALYINNFTCSESYFHF